jgi:LPS sulfotransferase NodH
MNKTQEIFESLQLTTLNKARLDTVNLLPSPRIKYILAITPRSGSSFLSDLLKKTEVLGTPQEFINQSFIPRHLQNKTPAQTPDDYLMNIFKVWKTKNGVAGIKASWFQFRNLYAILANPAIVYDYKYIYLTRANLAEQAVSLYKATESNVFHSVVKPNNESIEKLNSLEYNFDKINFWYQHILTQEEGWEQFFHSNNLSPLRINYDDICADWSSVIKKIALFIGIKQPGLNKINSSLSSITPSLKKMGDNKNILWAERFLQEKSQKSVIK